MQIPRATLQSLVEAKFLESLAQPDEAAPVHIEGVRRAMDYCGIWQTYCHFVTYALTPINLTFRSSLVALYQFAKQGNSD